MKLGSYSICIRKSKYKYILEPLSSDLHMKLINRMIAEDALVFCYDNEEKNCHVMVPENSSICQRCKCCRGKNFKMIDGIQYYGEEVRRWTELYLNEKSIAVDSKKLPIFFVSFENLQQALHVRREYIYQNYCCLKQIPKSQSTISKMLKTQNWKVMFAAMPKDILW